MHQIWLRTNRRLLVMGMILPAVLAAVGLVIVAVARTDLSWMTPLGWILVGVGLLLLAVVAAQLTVPRLAYRDGNLLIHLRTGSPIQLPVEFAECFFLTSGSGQLPGQSGKNLALRNLVIRIAEKATDFHQREVKPALGRWEEGYVTIYGAWCEPLNLDIVRRLNEQLAQAHQSFAGARDP